MKKTAIICAAALMTGTLAIAQPGPQGPRPEFNKEEATQKKTEMMAEKYGLNEDQQAKLLELNTEYADILATQGRHDGGPRGHRPGGPEMGPRPDGPKGPEMEPRPEAPEERPELTEEQKEELKAKMEERKAAMEAAKAEFEAKMAERKEKMDAYEAALKEIIGDEQFEEYKKDEERRAHGPQHGPGPGPRGPHHEGPENHDAEVMPIAE